MPSVLYRQPLEIQPANQELWAELSHETRAAALADWYTEERQANEESPWSDAEAFERLIQVWARHAETSNSFVEE